MITPHQQCCCDEKDRKREYDRKYREEHKQEREIYMKAYKEKNRARMSAYQKTYRELHPGRGIERAHRLGINRPMSIAKDTPIYLGVHIAERALSKFFDNIVRMPNGNPGYDFICGKGFKIDVKSSVLHKDKRDGNRSPFWKFSTRRNTVADYFLCLGFDNREALTPMHVWLIPGEFVNKKMLFQITNAPDILNNFLGYEQPIDRVISCCAQLRGHRHD